MGDGDAKWIFYGVMTVYVVWSVIALYLAPSLTIILVSATIAGYILVITPLHTLYINSRFLPKEIQPSVWRQIGLVLCSVFYGWFATMTMIHSVIPRSWAADRRPSVTEKTYAHHDRPGSPRRADLR